MKKRNGFTLIELLAIIVILAIIAVITVPIILNIIDNSKKGAAQDSAQGYTKSINQYFVSLLAQDKDNELPDGVYYLTETGELTNGSDTIEVDISGKGPTDGWVKLEQGNVISYSLKFDENVVSKNQNGEQTAEKTETVNQTDDIVITMTAERGTYESENAVKFVFNYQVPEYYEIQEAGINYGTNKLAGADTTVSGYGTVNLTEPNNLGVDDVENVFKNNTTGKIKTQKIAQGNYIYNNFTQRHNYAIYSNVNAYVYGIGYVDLITPTNQTIRVYSNLVATTYNSLPE